jgi:hypothetical protein
LSSGKLTERAEG